MVKMQINKTSYNNFMNKIKPEIERLKDYKYRPVDALYIIDKTIEYYANNEEKPIFIYYDQIKGLYDIRKEYLDKATKDIITKLKLIKISNNIEDNFIKYNSYLKKRNIHIDKLFSIEEFITIDDIINKLSAKSDSEVDIKKCFRDFSEYSSYSNELYNDFSKAKRFTLK